MTELVTEKLPIAGRIQIQAELLQCFPASDGMLRDELMAGVGGHHLQFFVRGDRKVDPDGTLRPTVIDRLKMKSVRNYVGFGPYRPKSLEGHPKAKEYYGNQVFAAEVTRDIQTTGSPY